MNNLSGVSASPELWSLLAARCDGAMTPRMWERLNQLLHDDPKARIVYILHMDQHAMLLWRYRDEFADDTSTNESGTASIALPASPVLGFLSTTIHGTIGFFSQEVPFACLIATVLCGLGIWIGSLVTVSRDVQISQQPAPPVAEPSRVEKIEYVGRITGMVDCKFVQSPESRVQSPESGSRPSTLVSLGDRYTLASGLMEITYGTGAKVILQGPVMYEVDSGSGGFLSIGKLTARVEKRGERRGERGDGENDKRETINDKLSVQRSAFSVQRSSNPQSLIPNPPLSTIHYPLFTIKTPTATVTDLGTEFGVEVQNDGGSKVHVMVGAVDLAAHKSGSHIRLSAADSKNAARVEAGSQKIIVLSAAPTQFVRAMPQHLRTIGSPLARLDYTDGTSGCVCVCVDESFPVDGTVALYGFRCDTPHTSSSSVTPLIFAREKNGRFVLTGIGESITAAAKGIQRAPFRLVAGSAEVKAGKHTFGHFDGAVAADGARGIKIVSRNTGAIAMSHGKGSWRSCYRADRANAVPVLNHSFEAPYENDYTQGDVPTNWIAIADATVAWGGMARRGERTTFYRTPNDSLIAAMPDGLTQDVYVNQQLAAVTGVYQILSATLQPNATYTLSVDVGQQASAPFPANASIQLGYGKTYGMNLLNAAEDWHETPDVREWKTWRKTFVTGPNPAGLGQPLRVELVVAPRDVGPQAHFDNVQLHCTSDDNADKPNGSGARTGKPNVKLGDVFLVDGAPTGDGSPEQPYRLDVEARTYSAQMSVSPATIKNEASNREAAK